MPEPTRIIIPLNGIANGQSQPRAIYDAFSSKVMSAIGTVETQRASNVEPGSNLGQHAVMLLSREYTERILADGVTIPHELRRVKPEYLSHWFADMTPCGHEVVLGPFQPHEKEKALAAEVQWLQDHNIPVCQRCTDSPTNIRAIDRTVPGRQLVEADYSSIELKAATLYQSGDNQP